MDALCKFCGPADLDANNCCDVCGCALLPLEEQVGVWMLEAWGDDTEYAEVPALIAKKIREACALARHQGVAATMAEMQRLHGARV